MCAEIKRRMGETEKMEQKTDVKNILVIFGGVSSEYEVSLESAYAVLCNLNWERYRALPLGISRQGQWFYYCGELAKIREDAWCNGEDCIPAVLSPDRTAHELLLLKGERVERIPVDVAFPVLHGRFGEDGTVQGLVELAGIPLAGCAALSSALCMDKDRAHRLAACFGVRVPKAMVLTKTEGMEAARAFGDQVGYPLFVKPVKAGSSYGVTKVEAEAQLERAIALARKYDDQVILEEAISGFEVGCAVLGKDRLIVGEVDEIELSGGFFDYTEKYTLKTSAIHVPARIAGEKARELQETAKRIYRALDCSGFARVDMFLTPEGEIVFNEVNTIPGFTEHSRYPGMMRAAGYSFGEILDIIIEQAQAE